MNKKYLLEDFGKRLKKARVDNGMTQQELADLINTSKSMISGYENGKNDPARSVLINLSKQLNLPISYLMGLDNNLDKNNQKNFLTKSSIEKKSNDDFFENLIPQYFFSSPQAAVFFLLNQDTIEKFNEFDITKLSEKNQLEYVNEILNQIKLVSYKYRKLSY